MKVELTKKAKKQLYKLPLNIQKRIAKKLYWFISQEKPLSFATQMTNPKFGKYKFRIGDYRVMFDIKGNDVQILFVLSIKHRGKAYEDI